MDHTATLPINTFISPLVHQHVVMSIYWLLQRVLLRKWACRYTFKLVLLLHLNVFPQVKLLDHKFSWSVMSNSLRPHGLQQARLPCPTPHSRASSNPCPSSQWCHPTISSSVIPFSSCLLHSLSGSFPVSQFFTLSGQSIGVSASASVLPMNIQDWFPLQLDWFDLLAVQGTLKSLLQYHSSKASILQHSAFFIAQLKIC